MRLLALVLILFGLAGASLNAEELTGDTFTHDPSRITKCDGKYYLYSTGPNCPMRFSTDLKHWTAGPNVLSGVPAWAHQAVPKADSDTIWAPDVLFFANQYHLYYSYSTFGSRISAVGLVTSPTLNPTSPKYHWTDQGEVVHSNYQVDYNAIDPCPVFDARGQLWLAFGSWQPGGIQIVRLDNASGKPVGTPVRLVAGQATGPEAAYVFSHKGWYYVFENEGLCCRGVQSTYAVMMGRSRSITGPYLDKAGKDLARDGGTAFLGTAGTEIGPGQIGIFRDGKRDVFTFHFYNGLLNGRPTLGMKTLSWSKDGWPLAQ